MGGSRKDRDRWLETFVAPLPEGALPVYDDQHPASPPLGVITSFQPSSVGIEPIFQLNYTRRPRVNVNPCGEIPLEPFELCVLAYPGSDYDGDEYDSWLFAPAEGVP